MSDRISRREFLKIAGIGAGLSAVLTGCGPASRYITRKPYTDMPEYTQTGESTYWATTCGECSAGCGLIVRTMSGRAHKVDGNQNHPVNHGKTCSRGQVTLEGLYNPDRITAPGKQASRGSGQFSAIEWTEAVKVVSDAFKAGGVTFLLGLFPDHLADLVQMIAKGMADARVVRYGTLAEFDQRATLVQAAQKAFGQAKMPVFDLANAGIVLSFGANFLETWLSPVSFTVQYGTMRQGHTGRRGYLVQFEPRMSLTAANADEWYPIVPGSEALLVQGLGRLVAETKSVSVPAAFAGVDIADVAAKTGIMESDLRQVAELFATNANPLALPGGVALAQTNGLAVAEAILALNALVDNLGKEGGIFLMPDSPLYPESEPSTGIAELSTLVDEMNAGRIKTLLIHGVNPVYDLPHALGFQQALQKVPLIVSFASFPDETAQLADYVMPDNTPLESWGYQKIRTGSNHVAVSGLQPVVVSMHKTMPTSDVLLAAVQAVGGALASAVPYQDEVAFLQESLMVLNNQGGFYSAPTEESFFNLFQQYGGWWQEKPGLEQPTVQADFWQSVNPGNPQFEGDPAGYTLLPFPSSVMGEGSGANRPWLQEAPDPMTTVMWNTWVEIGPETAQKLGVANDDVVKITSPNGQVEASVYVYPAIRPGVIAVPLGQGHTAFGRYAQGRGANILQLLSKQVNAAGDLAYAATLVKVEPAGKQHKLARYESRTGVYGNNE